jgi:hypothetical protein
MKNENNYIIKGGEEDKKKNKNTVNHKTKKMKNAFALLTCSLLLLLSISGSAQNKQTSLFREMSSSSTSYLQQAGIYLMPAVHKI